MSSPSSETSYPVCGRDLREERKLVRTPSRRVEGLETVGHGPEEASGPGWWSLKGLPGKEELGAHPRPISTATCPQVDRLVLHTHTLINQTWLDQQRGLGMYNNRLSLTTLVDGANLARWAVLPLPLLQNDRGQAVLVGHDGKVLCHNPPTIGTKARNDEARRRGSVRSIRLPRRLGSLRVLSSQTAELTSVPPLRPVKRHVLFIEGKRSK